MRAAVDPFGILFVCTGNICRSPTAEGVFRDRVVKARLDQFFRIDSAGTDGWHEGEPPDPRSIAMARKFGVDIAPLRARAIKSSDFDDFDLILALDQSHYDFLSGSKKRGHAVVRMFLEFADQDRRDVPDPYYGQENDFLQVYELIERGVDGLLGYLRKELRL